MPSAPRVAAKGNPVPKNTLTIRFLGNLHTIFQAIACTPNIRANAALNAANGGSVYVSAGLPCPGTNIHQAPAIIPAEMAKATNSSRTFILNAFTSLLKFSNWRLPQSYQRERRPATRPVYGEVTGEHG